MGNSSPIVSQVVGVVNQIGDAGKQAVSQVQNGTTIVVNGAQMVVQNLPGYINTGVNYVETYATFPLNAAEFAASLASYSAAQGGGTDNRNWMSKISNGTSFSLLYIPGTHDSCTGVNLQNSGNMLLQHTWKCHGFGLDRQLNDGIRYLDIRLKVSGTDFVIHHGSIYLEQNFDGVLTTCKSFLSANPTEVVLMQVSNEGGDDSSWGQILDNYVTKRAWTGLFVQSDVDCVCIGPANRGKIVLLRKSGGGSCGSGLCIGNNWSYPVGGEGVITMSNGGKYKYIVEDHCIETSCAAKENWIALALNKPLTNTNYAGYLNVIYCSSIGGTAPVGNADPNPYPFGLASGVNNWLNMYLKKNGLGGCTGSVLVMDFYLKSNVDMIISANMPSRWVFHTEGPYLVLRDSSASRDCRYAFIPNCGSGKNYGSGGGDANCNGKVVDFGGGWIANEENGILCLRNTAMPGDNRYAFWPNTYQDFGNCNNPNSVPYIKTFYQGARFSFRDENGVFVIRDLKAAGDSRYAFWPGNYVDM